MKYSYTWLKELSGTKKTPKQLAELLTMHAFELEDMKTEGKETQLTFDILANRGHDALSHIGMAREICALENRQLNLPASHFLTNRKGLSVKINDTGLCRRYIGVALENIKVAPSPKWMRARLLVCGIKPINNIVDITNYVMLETGQPLHAFDANKTTGNIIVRQAKKGEKIRLLDESEKIMISKNLVIADSEKALALAGVMGGLKSGVMNKTKKIILEAANFDPVSIRKTRTAHNISTESSYRFERDIDSNLAETAAARAIELIRKYGGKNVKAVTTADIYPKKIKPWTIKLDLEYVNSLLGENIPANKIKKILESLDIKVKSSEKYIIAEIPTIRIDLKTQEDLIEEIGRIYGYENISAKVPAVELSAPPVNEKRVFEDKLRDCATSLGFSEMLNYSFYSADDIEKCGLAIDEHLEVANPMNPDQQYLRTVLVPGILKNVETNLKNFDKFSIFEIGRIYSNHGQKLPDEKTFLAGALVDIENKKEIFFELKGKIEALLEKLGIENIEFSEPKVAGTIVHPTRAAVMRVRGRTIGYIGKINPKILGEYRIKNRVAAFELDTQEMQNLASSLREYRPISKFPSVKRDISMFVPEGMAYADIEKEIAKSGGRLVKNIELFDVFEKEGRKSLAIRLEIGSDKKTLTSAEIDGMMKKIVSRLEKDLKVKVRK